jgi:hypothetical protein
MSPPSPTRGRAVKKNRPQKINTDGKREDAGMFLLAEPEERLADEKSVISSHRSSRCTDVT